MVAPTREGLEEPSEVGGSQTRRSNALDGRSLASLIAGDAPSPAARPAFSELARGGTDCKNLNRNDPCLTAQVAVQTRRFKLVVSRNPASEQLYDLEADPLETRDVKAQHPGELAAYRALANAYLKEAVSGSGRSGGGRSHEGEPEPVAPEESNAIDAAIRDRLRALGYLD